MSPGSPKSASSTSPGQDTASSTKKSSSEAARAPELAADSPTTPGADSGDAPGPQPAPPSLFAGKLWFWGPILPLLALDLWSKWAAFAFLAERFPDRPPYARSYAVWSEDAPIRFHLVGWHNTGTIWGLGQSLTEVLIVLRFVALALIVYFARRLPPTARLQQLVLGMIMAGALGNLYDNLTERQSGVRDFLLFSAEIGGETWKFPAFNVADSCICVGAITLAILLWRSDAPQDAPAEPV